MRFVPHSGRPLLRVPQPPTRVLPSTLLPALGAVGGLNFALSQTCVVVSYFNLQSPDDTEGEHLFRCLFVIFGKLSLYIFAPFLVRFPITELRFCYSAPWPFSRCVLRWFSPHRGLSSHSHDCVFLGEVSRWDASGSSILSLTDRASGVVSTTSSPNPRSSRFSPL